MSDLTSLIVLLKFFLFTECEIYRIFKFLVLEIFATWLQKYNFNEFFVEYTKGIYLLLVEHLNHFGPCKIICENNIEPTKEELTQQKIKALRIYYQKFELGSPLRTKSVHWYEAIEAVISKFDEEEATRMMDLVTNWRPLSGSDPHFFSEEERGYIKTFMELFGMDRIPPGELIHILSRIEADAILDPQVMRDPENGWLRITMQAAPASFALELRYLVRVREFLEHEHGVMWFDRYYRLALLEFYHENKQWLKLDRPLTEITQKFTKKQFGEKNYPEYNLDAFKAFPSEALTLLSDDLSDLNPRWIMQKNHYLLNYAIRQMDGKRNYNAILVETGLCDYLELERFRIRYLIARERDSLSKGGDYQAFKNKYGFWIKKLNESSNFEDEEKAYRLLERNYLYYAQLHNTRILNDIIYRKTFHITDGYHEVHYSPKKLGTRLKCLFLLDSFGYFSQDAETRFALNYIIKYDWRQFRSDGHLSPLSNYYLGTVNLYPTLLQLQRVTGISDQLLSKFLHDEELLLDFLMINRWNPNSEIIIEENMRDTYEIEKNFGDPFLDEPYF